ncbi:S-layer homology domain-containing protein [Alkalicoccus chagannorensis]|uniref:S-layer homology domain-containing protein n=1 Tax=Alkalicoccus chagannorensis TaxID=427072 RepID=UPI001FE062CC|nr:S-layer homology domain-containing protein [Alkalicoccus chagannorensis]
MGKAGKTLAAATAAAVLFLPESGVKAQSFSDVSENAYYHQPVTELVGQGIIGGYDDNTFRPGVSLQRKHAAALLTRALDLDEGSSSTLEAFDDVDGSHPFAADIASLADAGIIEGDGEKFHPSAPTTREQMASILVRAFDPASTGRESNNAAIHLSNVMDVHQEDVQTLADFGLTTELDDFLPKQETSRGQFATFLHRTIVFQEGGEVLAPEDPDTWRVNGIEIGDDLADVQDMWGSPEETVTSHQGFDWHIYHNGYRQVRMAGIENEDVVALYSGNPVDITGNTKAQARDRLGEPASYIQRSRNRTNLSDADWRDYFDIEEGYAAVFYDTHQGDRINGVQITASSIEERQTSIRGDLMPADEEKLMFTLLNATRVQQGLDPLAHHERAADAARAHSQDMADRGYFNHRSPEGLNATDRMREAGISFRSRGENISRGHASAVFSQQSLFNSDGHRRAMLHPDFDLVGVGVAKADDNHPYYTQKLFVQ